MLREDLQVIEEVTGKFRIMPVRQELLVRILLLQRQELRVLVRLVQPREELLQREAVYRQGLHLLL